MQELEFRNYDRRMQGIFSKAERTLSEQNLDLIRRYDSEMATLGLKKSTRVKQISLIVDMSIRIGKNQTGNQLRQFLIMRRTILIMLCIFFVR